MIVSSVTLVAITVTQARWVAVRVVGVLCMAASQRAKLMCALVIAP
jgi:hypothetical protein